MKYIDAYETEINLIAMIIKKGLVLYTNVAIKQKVSN